MGFGAIGPNGYEDSGQPCPSCNRDADPKAPGSFAPKRAVKATVQWVDAVGSSSAEDSGTDASAFFSPQDIARQRAIDAAKEAGMTAD